MKIEAPDYVLWHRHFREIDKLNNNPRGALHFALQMEGITGIDAKNFFLELLLAANYAFTGVLPQFSSTRL
ncbi:MAG: hypothetical protein L0215_13775 [Gemmataceae bacterium]|nr:hypothetical protein [Gemmataceae bacterium]